MDPFWILLGLALIFDFLNGFHDSANIVATVISSRALNPRLALIVAAVSEFSGPFLFGVAVAKTVGDGLLHVEALQTDVIIAALAASVLWNLITWYLGIPSSSSHALVGGLIGSSVLAAGLDVVQVPGLLTILIALLISPVIGLIVGFILMRVILLLAHNATPAINTTFKRLQLATLIGLGLSHGTNDAQKTMGVIALGLLLSGREASFYVPLWVITASALSIALGTSLGGWRLIRTLGGRIYRIRPVHGFASQIAGASVILGAALLGGPVSTTQVLSSSIVGAGAAERINKIRWNVMGEMVVAWLLTIPISAGMSALCYLAINGLI